MHSKQRDKNDTIEPASLELVRIPLDGVMLDGELAISKLAKGLVLFAHGSGSSRHSPRNQFVARILRQSGSATLLFDLLTPEEEAEDAYTGQLRFNVSLLAQRLIGAARWSSLLPAAKPLRIGFFGSSTGAAAALIAAASLGASIDAVVSRGGRPDLAMEELSRVRAPTLLIVGGRDQEVLRLNERAFAALRCQKELSIVPGATHLFEEPGALDRVANLAAGWFHAHWKAPAQVQ